jgi:hypothetical protein
MPQCRRASRAPVLSGAHKGGASSAVSVRLGTASTATSNNTASTRPTTRTRASKVFALDNSSDELVCKRGFCFSASTGPTAEVKAVLKNPLPQLMDCTEFDNLPPAIQRKVSSFYIYAPCYSFCARIPMFGGISWGNTGKRNCFLLKMAKCFSFNLLRIFLESIEASETPLL